MEKELEIYLKKSTSGILSGKRKGCYHSTFDVYFHLKFGKTNNVQLSTTVNFQYKPPPPIHRPIQCRIQTLRWGGGQTPWAPPLDLSLLSTCKQKKIHPLNTSPPRTCGIEINLTFYDILKFKKVMKFKKYFH